MRIVHCADLHLGVENYSAGINPDTGLSLRFHDFLDAFDEVVQFALDERVDLVLFCGDAYKSREPSQTHQREFARRIWKLASNGVAVFLLTGNHDLPNAIGRATTIEIFKTLSISNVTVANTPGTYCIDTNAGPLQIVALPWAKRSALLNRDETRNLTAEEINRRMESILTELLEQEITALDPAMPSILAAHITIASAKYGSERGMIMGTDYSLLLSNAANPVFDYVALGHIHKKQVLAEAPPVVYAGSLQRIDFSEEGDDKGFFAVEIDERRNVQFDFHPVKARRFVTIKVDIDEREIDPTAAVIGAIEREDVSEAVVRLQISLSESCAASLDETAIHRALKPAYAVASVAREVRREHRARLAGFSAEGLEPIEALKAYCEVKKPSVDAELLIEYGGRIIRENLEKTE